MIWIAKMDKLLWVLKENEADNGDGHNFLKDTLVRTSGITDCFTTAFLIRRCTSTYTANKYGSNGHICCISNKRNVITIQNRN